ncbi:MAG: DUF1501 domain-containing protein [Planctomycetales bacterium]
MLSIWGARQKSLCSGLARRDFLRIGGLGACGLTLADLLRLRAEGGIREGSRAKSVIMVYLPGGPSHIDMYDMKPHAPVEFRGEFNPVRTNVSGLELCELMPRQALLADKFLILRGVKTFGNGHDAYEILTSDPREAAKLPPNPLPAFGSVVSKVREGERGDVPSYVGIKNLHLVLPSNNDDPETAAYLGDAYRPFRTDGPGLENLSLAAGVSLDRLAERKSLLGSLDNLRRGLDGGRGTFSTLDAYTAQALALVSSNKVREAFNLEREPSSVRSLYGEATDFLLARRLVEAGVSVVTLPCRFRVKIGDFAHGTLDHWDTHWHNFRYLREMLPRYDQAVAALITDLYQRGLDQEVAVVVWGEFGRTPLIDYTLVPGTPGRGHWPEASCVLLSGGGLTTGQVVGETDPRAERSKGLPLTPSHVLATLYHVLGIDPARTFPDRSGRPRFILDQRDPIRELI